MKNHIDILNSFIAPLIIATSIADWLIGSAAENMDCDIF